MGPSSNRTFNFIGAKSLYTLPAIHSSKKKKNSTQAVQIQCHLNYSQTAEILLAGQSFSKKAG